MGGATQDEVQYVRAVVRAMRCGAVRCGAVRCGAVAVRRNAVQCSAVRFGEAQCSAVHVQRREKGFVLCAV